MVCTSRLFLPIITMYWRNGPTPTTELRLVMPYPYCHTKANTSFLPTSAMPDSQITKFKVVRGKQLYGQVVLEVRVRPGTYAKQAETEGGAKRIFDDYSVIPEGEIEWYSHYRGRSCPVECCSESLARGKSEKLRDWHVTLGHEVVARTIKHISYLEFPSPLCLYGWQYDKKESHSMNCLL